jgi:protein phosphatase
LNNATYDDTEKVLTEAIQYANRNIRDEALNDSTLFGMGTTCVLVFIQNDGGVFIGHVGDSRCYLFNRKKELLILTKDHSYVEFLIEIGDVKREDAFDHPAKNKILKSLGNDDKVDPDVYKVDFNLHTNDTLLLCTDGLNDMLRDHEIQDILSQHNSPQLQTEALVQAALENGGKDNITITCIKIENSPFVPVQELNEANDKQRKRNMVPFLLFGIFLLGLMVYLFYPRSQDTSNLDDKKQEEVKPKLLNEDSLQRKTRARLKESNEDLLEPSEELPDSGAILVNQ